ncbi:MAG: hypothetical protein M1816_000928 [Peltula sp. TS41687]|nr:MAG: hypothetical protein M1816_000928 [Peltula sp. TS41687]
MNGQADIQGEDDGFGIWSPSSSSAIRGGPTAIYPTSSSHGQFPSSVSSTTAFSGNTTHPHFHQVAAPPYLSAHPTSSTTPMADEQQHAHLEKLAQAYHPEVIGPLVGKRQSSEAITTEYRNADPVYVQKTAALPQKFSHYRAIRGDGNCGWRALAFGYFETLIRNGGRSRILEEQTRLKSLNNLLNRVGFDKDLYEDFVDETFHLLRELASLLPSPDAASILLQRFNSDEVSSAIITHFRLLTSAWMKTRTENYLPFLVGTVEDYCATQIEPYQVEIEHVGMNALIDVLVKPAGFAVEILYLDRSPGLEVNTHRFEETGANGMPMYPDAPTIYLLYRPGHYDILYKFDIQVNLVSNISSYNTIQSIPMASPTSPFNPYLAAIPGMSNFTGGGGGMIPIGLSTTDLSIPPEYPPPPTSPVSPLPPTFSPTRGLALRPSRYQVAAELHAASTAHTQHYQTPSFRNSHFNPAHFLSTDFQPEIWTPEHEGGGGGAGKNPREDPAASSSSSSHNKHL